MNLLCMKSKNYMNAINKQWKKNKFGHLFLLYS